MVSYAPMFAVPDTLKVVTPVMTPSMSAAPVMVKALLPPAKVLCVFTVEAVSVRSPPLKVTAPA